MTSLTRLTAAASIGALALAAAACTPAEDANDANEAGTAAEDTNTTTIIEREVPVPTPPVVVEDRREGDSTTVRAGEDGLKVETTNR